MIRKISLFVVYLALAVSPSFGQEWAAKMFKTTEHDFGTVARGSKAEFHFTLSNLYLDDVHIVTAYSSCGCTSVDVINPTLKTYEEGIVRAVFNTPTFLGSRSATITVVIDKPMPAEVLLHIRGVIRGDVVFEPGSVQLGDVEMGTSVERKVQVNRSGWGDWQITDVKSSNPHISAKVVNTNRQNGRTTADLSVTLDKDAPVGYLQDHLLLITSEGQSIQMPLAVEGRVVSNLTCQPFVAVHGHRPTGAGGNEVARSKGEPSVQSAFDWL